MGAEDWALVGAARHSLKSRAKSWCGSAAIVEAMTWPSASKTIRLSDDKLNWLMSACRIAEPKVSAPIRLPLLSLTGIETTSNNWLPAWMVSMRSEEHTSELQSRL